jgi:sugar transferase (PEP-CTERM system associated)
VSLAVLPRLTWRRLTLVSFESVLIAAAIAAGVQLRLGSPAWRGPDLAIKILLMTAVCQCGLYYRNMYDCRVLERRAELLARVLQGTAAAALLLALLFVLAPALLIGQGVFLTSAALLIGAVTAWRLAFEWVAPRGPRERLLLVGTSAAAAELVAELRARTDHPATIIGAVAGDPGAAGDLGVLGTIEDIPAIVRSRGIDRVVVNLADARGKLPMDKLLEMRLDGVRFDHLASVYERYTGRIPVEDLRPSWFIFSDGFRKTRLFLAAKRAGDVTGALLALVAFAPLMLIVAAAVRLTSAGPILYRQRRVGQDGRVFTLRKFRSMRVDAEASTGAVWAVPHDDRVTPLGRLLRRSHLDELPQLWNILSGDMSLVGPRPERPEFVRELTRTIPFYGQRHVVKPGLTGWAQVCYPYGASVEDSMRKLQYDLFYIKHMSLPVDAYVLFETVKNVVQGRGV